MADVSTPFVDPAVIRAMAWGGSYDRGVAYFRSGAVRRMDWDGAGRVLTAEVRGSGRNVYRCTVRLDGAGGVASAVCSCPVQEDCKHAVAALLASNAAGAPAVVVAAPPGSPAGSPGRAGGEPVAPPTWRSLLAADAAGTASASAPLALGVELRQRTAYRADDWSPRRMEAVTPRALAGRHDDLSLVVRPLRRSARTDAWIKGDASWEAMRRGAAGFDAAHVRWFAELLAILRGTGPTGGFGDPGEWIALDAAESSLLWPHLRAAAPAGIPLVPASAHQTVALAAEAEIAIHVAAEGDALRVRTRARIDGLPDDAVVIRPVGHVGVYAVALDRDPAPIVLAPCALPESIHALLGVDGGLLVPPEEREVFLAEGLPRLMRRATVTAAGISLPVPAEPAAVVTTAFGDDAVDYRIEWSYPGLVRRPYPPVAHPDRDPVAEQPIRAALETAWAEATDIPFASSARLVGIEAAEFAARVLPAWAQLTRVRIEGDAPRRAYTELTDEPEISVTTVPSDDPDWFDLGVIVSIGGRHVPLARLLTALTRGTRKLLLSDGAYFSLAHPALHRLRDLLAEAAELDEWEPESTRISRHQTDLWADFEDLADEAVPAQEWRALVEGLHAVDTVPPSPVPSALMATLRPYQQTGFDWLAFLWRHRLGGILADDMGLGKTVQLLALAAHIHTDAGAAPVLVIAPTSVVATWAAEAARFVPGLVVRTIEGTSARTGTPVAAAAAGAHLVVTSYALLRLDGEQYGAVRWSALVLDEAQFLKNPRTKLHRSVAALRADAAYAATGTPLENGLTDLWALLSLTAPGLFPSARGFREHYVRPIQQGAAPDDQDAEAFRAGRLARLRRRIRPLLLRRTKQAVAPELPPKQEQELRVTLDPAHRALYDRMLQRERQKVLGLLDDLDRNRFIVFRSLTLLRMLSLAPALIDPGHAQVPSSKLDALIERIAEVSAEGHRALVFSQFTSFLQLAAQRLEAAGIPSVYLDGATRRRDAVIEEFRGGTAPVFLISLKAGGFGLTLTEADYVFVLDPWWNPAAEAQAVDRAHRIGQDRTVMVYRLIAADTIEEKVVALQHRKAALFQAVVDDDALFAQALTADDIRSLLES